MEQRRVEGGDDSSQDLQNHALEPFNCSICLELVYKPVVHACGHMFCFWCTFQAMDYEKQSLCPVCRQPYIYFPRPCQLLHVVLTKAASEEYTRRGREIQRTEEREQIFSPCLSKLPDFSQIWKDSTGSNFEGHAVVNSTVVLLNAEGSVGINDNNSIIESSQNKDSECERRESTERSSTLMQDILSVDDFRCFVCRGLLYRPVVLNCGDVFCETCLERSNSKLLQCPCCNALHPCWSVRVCLGLHQYLEATFPAEYLEKHLQSSEENNISVDNNTADFGGSIIGDLHKGAGCDGCGMCPIIGDRYSCEECTEAIGFDLCGICYTNGGKLWGRFNQNHLANHRMERIKLS